MRIFSPRENDKLRVRRHIALTCLLFNILIVVVLMVAIFLGPPDRGTVIDNITEIILSISVLTGGFTGAWFHSAYQADKKRD